ncbi:hypothetical protein QTP88_008659 [Uroleucon formosanum]
MYQFAEQHTKAQLLPNYASLIAFECIIMTNYMLFYLKCFKEFKNSMLMLKTSSTPSLIGHRYNIVFPTNVVAMERLWKRPSNG